MLFSQIQYKRLLGLLNDLLETIPKIRKNKNEMIKEVELQERASLNNIIYLIKDIQRIQDKFHPPK